MDTVIKSNTRSLSGSTIGSPFVSIAEDCSLPRSQKKMMPFTSHLATSPISTYFFAFASSTALILSLAARLPPNFGPDDVAPAAPALAFAAGWRRERFRASACARKSALKASAAAASGSRVTLLLVALFLVLEVEVEGV